MKLIRIIFAGIVLSFFGCDVLDDDDNGEPEPAEVTDVSDRWVSSEFIRVAGIRDYLYADIVFLSGSNSFRGYVAEYSTCVEHTEEVAFCMDKRDATDPVSGLWSPENDVGYLTINGIDYALSKTSEDAYHIEWVLVSEENRYNNWYVLMYKQLITKSYKDNGQDCQHPDSWYC